LVSRPWSSAGADPRLSAGDRPAHALHDRGHRHRLTQDGLVLRYRNGPGLNADGLAGEEGTLVICSFWLVSALARAGEVDRAEELLQRLFGYANDLGLLTEQIDPGSGEQLGNFPQAFSHIGLITAAHDLDMARAARAVE
jgi:GH15 family glucan-1,4-alpha-glucosidase